MTDLLVDVHMSEGLLEMQGSQMSDIKNYGQEVMAAVLLKHGVTRAQYDSSLVWYSQNLKKLIRIYNHVDQELLNRQDSWIAASNEHRSVGVSISGDQVDVWGLSRSFLLDESRRTGVYRWQMSTDTCFHAGDTIQWHLRINEMPKSQALVASVVLLGENKVYNSKEFVAGLSTVCFKTDSMVVLTTAPADKSVDIRQINLSLHLLHMGVGYEDGFSPVLVDSMKLIRIHRK